MEQLLDSCEACNARGTEDGGTAEILFGSSKNGQDTECFCKQTKARLISTETDQTEKQRC